jgi:hypothetical protein
LNILRLATACQAHGGLQRLTAAAYMSSLSPVSFNSYVYVDVLICLLCTFGYGCHMLVARFMDALRNADDLLILTQSDCGIKHLLNYCYKLSSSIIFHSIPRNLCVVPESLLLFNSLLCRSKSAVEPVELIVNQVILFTIINLFYWCCGI